ncbi:Hypothetical_protein [Hexamita inflata]|uniref:Hypothetical_protein n=1 Tax=Hexamita inflata TaxID=28002 RepID=A0AA86R4P1_9EUKA|nr:Hypothetical protein HINF_LOCUS59151 [Hexamita inflata]
MVGNLSSYLLCQVMSSQIIIFDLVVVIGNSSYYQVSTNSTSSISNQYQFGGVTGIIVNSQLNIEKLLYHSYQQYDTQYLQYSGSIIGISQQQVNIVIIKNMCFDLILKSNSIFGYYGLIGYNSGNITLDKLSISQNITGVLSIHLGVIGALSANCLFSQISNIITSMNTKLNTQINEQYHVSLLISYQYAKLCQINNVTLQDSNIYLPHGTSGFITDAVNTNVLIQNSVVNRCTLISEYTSSIICWGLNSVISVENVSISFIKVTGKYAKLIYSLDAGSSFTLQQSWSFGYNYVNQVLQGNCALFTNVQGC